MFEKEMFILIAFILKLFIYLKTKKLVDITIPDNGLRKYGKTHPNCE